MSEITIYTLAKELGMTPSMVSRAFNPNAKIREEKRQLVLETAEKYGFSPNKFASRLSMKSVSIGIVMNSRFKINEEKMLAGIERAYVKFKDYKIKYTITVVDAHKDKTYDYRSLFAEVAKCDGIIISGFGAKKYLPLITELTEKNPNLVQVQSINEFADCLFTSKHDERVAAEIAAEFLYNCLKRSCRRNVVLFAGNLETDLHKSASAAFTSACNDLGMSLIEIVDINDNEEILAQETKRVFEKHSGKIDGIYITSGVSLSLCEYMKKHENNISLVTFDTYDKIGEYLHQGVISATISQNVSQQMENAFEMLIKYLINNEQPTHTVYTDVQLVLKSNYHLFNC